MGQAYYMQFWMLGIPDVGYSGCWVFGTFEASIVLET